MEKFICDLKRVYEDNIRSALIAFVISAFGTYVFWGNEVINPDTLIRGIPHVLGSWDIQIGRYGLYLFYALNRGFSSGYFTSFISLFFFLLAGVCIVDLYEVKNELVKIIVLVLIIASPYSIAVITFPFCSDANGASVFFAVFSIWIWKYFKEDKLAIILGAFSLAFSISIYQSNIGITGIVGLTFVIKEVLIDKKNLKNFLSFAILVIMGSVLYYIGLKISLIVYNVEISAYKGGSEVNIANIIKKLPESIPQSYREFFSFYFTKSLSMSNSFGTSMIYIILGITSIASIIIFIKEKKLERVQIILVCILLLLSPVACNLIDIIIPGTGMLILLTAPMMVFPVVLFTLSYSLMKENKIINKLMRSILAIFLLFLALNYNFINNVDGVEQKRHEDQTLFLANRIYSKLEDKGALTNHELKVGIYGNPSDGNYKWKDYMSEYINYHANLGYIYEHSYPYSFRGWSEVFKRYLGDTSINWCNVEDTEKILKSDEFKKAPVYPDEGSILQIDDVLVVKMANYTEN